MNWKLIYWLTDAISFLKKCHCIILLFRILKTSDDDDEILYGINYLFFILLMFLCHMQVKKILNILIDVI